LPHPAKNRKSNFFKGVPAGGFDLAHKLKTASLLQDAA
jgi:hypothetical protein